MTVGGNLYDTDSALRCIVVVSADSRYCHEAIVLSHIQDGRSDHERQYLYCQSVDASDNSELVKTPK